MFILRDRLPSLWRARIITVFFALSSFLLPVLAALVLVLNLHMKYSLKAQFSDNKHVIHAREKLQSSFSFVGDKFKFEPDLRDIRHINTMAISALFCGIMVADAYIIAWGNLGTRSDVVDKLLHEPPSKFHDFMIIPILQVFLYGAAYSVFDWLEESGFKGCTFSRNDQDLQILRCPAENAACAVLPYFKVQRWWAGSVCWEARIVRYCLVIIFASSAILLRVYAPYEWKRRRTMRFYIIRTAETENLMAQDMEAGQPAEETSMEDKQAGIILMEKEAH